MLPFSYFLSCPWFNMIKVSSTAPYFRLEKRSVYCLLLEPFHREISHNRIHSLFLPLQFVRRFCIQSWRKWLLSNVWMNWIESSEKSVSWNQENYPTKDKMAHDQDQTAWKPFFFLYITCNREDYSTTKKKSLRLYIIFIEYWTSRTQEHKTICSLEKTTDKPFRASESSHSWGADPVELTITTKNPACWRWKWAWASDQWTNERRWPIDIGTGEV